MAKKKKKTYRHGGKAEYAKLHDLSQKEYDKFLLEVGGKKETAYKRGGRFRPQHN